MFEAKKRVGNGDCVCVRSISIPQHTAAGRLFHFCETNPQLSHFDRATFRSKVKNALAELGMRLTRLENAEPLKKRLESWSVDAELTKIAEEVRNSGQVGFGTFHAFDAD